ncbi:trypsin-like peptidase domain-containing protein [uncultured Fretibacterium sp.]|uniref:trypsin-like peptidase domain-containing protein n=1 Tax=uncultured Fretibacterium sp. TaxID=1678694 RepID=UPI002603367B|nr:trypsin-like peptidase domain-containing protein [uncultured Fretibacterium sp.]
MSVEAGRIELVVNNAYLHLGISPDATIEEIERAYEIKRRLYEPSRFIPNSPEQQEAQRMSMLIELAYNFASATFYASHPPQPTVHAAYPADDRSTDYPLRTQQSSINACSYSLSLPAREATKRGRWIAIMLALLAVSVLCLAAAIFFRSGKPNGEIDMKAMPQQEGAWQTPEVTQAKSSGHGIDYAALTERVMPSILRINTDTGKFGSGFFVSDRGDILTNYHVIEGVRWIIASPYKGDPFYALVKDTDKSRDMALLVMSEPMATPFLPIKDSLPRQGEAVMAIGNPKGLDRTVSNGIVSAFRDNDTLIQFTAPISPGSSGGALIDSEGKVIGMPTGGLGDGQNLNFAIASPVLNRFLMGAKNKVPEAMPKMTSRRPESSSILQEDKNLLFVRSDSGYEVYLDLERIVYDKETSRATFISVWFPSEKIKASLKKDPNFKLIAGKELGVFVLVYMADLSDGTYVHLRTVNFYADGTVARDYTRPRSQLKWEVPERDSRIESLMRVLLRRYGKAANVEATKKRIGPKSGEDGISLPDERGFLVHQWGCSVESIRKYVAAPLKKVGNTGRLFSTQRSFKAFRCKVDVFVLYEFKRNQLCSIGFLLDDENAGEYVDTIIEELSDLYGTDPYEDYKDDCHISYSWKTSNLFVMVNYTLEDDKEWVSVDFHYTPLKFGK